MLSEAGLIAETEMKAVPSHYVNVIVDCYAVMPNHVHGIVVIEEDHVYSPVETGLAPSPASAHGRSLSAIVGSYKAGVSPICRAKGLSDFAWQARFHDHILRSNASLNAVRDYIGQNPQNWLQDPANPGGAA
jgi:putative transposase